MSTAVQNMFASIAPSYDRVNTVLSFGAHHSWRRAAVRHAGIQPGHSVLDCATGTGDLAMRLKRAVGPEGKVLGTDFCAEMLSFAPAKARAAGLDITFQQADAMALPFPSADFDAATIAFGIRNVDDPVACLREMARVVRPGGKVAVLEFGQPQGVIFGPAYRYYSQTVMPFAGGLISGNPDAYRYLPETAAAFPAGENFLDLMRQAGVYAEVRMYSLWFGIAYVYVGTVREG